LPDRGARYNGLQQGGYRQHNGFEGVAHNATAVAGFAGSLFFGAGAKCVPVILVEKHIGCRNSDGVTFVANELLAIFAL